MTVPALLMGIVNVTPDSFSDGGRFAEAGAAVEWGLRLEAEGAAVIDVGGESTRPGAQPVPLDEELRRVVPVVRALCGQARVPVSVDTTKAGVAIAALEAGASWVNCVRGLDADPALLRAAAMARATLVLMHLRGDPATMQREIRFRDVVAEVVEELACGVARAEAEGMDPQRIVVDPGIGFGKSAEQSHALLRELPRLCRLGHAVLVGPSRKSFLALPFGEAGSPSQPADRLLETAAAVTACVLGGARYIRVHDVAAMQRVVKVACALL